MSSSLRKAAVSNIASRKPEAEEYCRETAITEIFGKDVFNLKIMKDFLPKDVYKRLLATIRNGAPLDSGDADAVANAMKRWAIDKGASHYTHWFQPLTGSTAEKHDAFISSDLEGGVMMSFSGKSLTMGEPDASSFPSGGLRATFEARGYTAWDPTSPAFIKRDKNGATLCIPTAFCSYHGEALDKKTPLLRSIQAIDKQARRVLACLGEKFDCRVIATLGAEQEYFLIDKELFMARPDILQTERTLFGKEPAKHQQMEDHYFAAIKPRVLRFMNDVDYQLWILGIPAKTRHNEVAPAQFEIAAMFEELNLAVDHNMLIMEVLRKTADDHGFVCLVHEKPFAGINGSGKHNNWSLNLATGQNLLDPGTDPLDNAIFLTFLCAVIKAVDTYPELLRATVASAGNDHRLGANEAPPAIISIYLGDLLTEVIEQIEKGETQPQEKQDVDGSMYIGVDALPVLPRDTTDRNRTSPLAFTGNKFEFRAPGSNQSCAGPNTVINTIVAEALDDVATELESVNENERAKTLQQILQDIIKKHKRIIFNGDNYSGDWVKIAESRGLPNLRTTPEALKHLKSEKSVAVLEKYKVLNKTELYSRYEVFMEEYEKKIIIEGGVAHRIAMTMILPTAVKQQALLLENLRTLKELSIKAGVREQKKRVEEIGGLIDSLGAAAQLLKVAVEKEHINVILKEMTNLRNAVDGLENEVDDALWALPKYSELLFIY